MPKNPGGIFIKPGLSIPEAELAERFIQSSGPGGQNVNKVASAVQLSFDVAQSPSLSAAVRAALLAAGGARLSKDGVLTITARRFREQERNRADAGVRLAEILRDGRHAAKTPPRHKAHPGQQEAPHRSQEASCRAEAGPDASSHAKFVKRAAGDETRPPTIISSDLLKYVANKAMMGLSVTENHALLVDVLGSKTGSGP